MEFFNEKLRRKQTSVFGFARLLSSGFTFDLPGNELNEFILSHFFQTDHKTRFGVQLVGSLRLSLIENLKSKNLDALERMTLDVYKHLLFIRHGQHEFDRDLIAKSGNE